MENVELEKGKAHVTVEIIEYLTGAVLNKTIVKKLTGDITAMSFANGEGLAEKVSPFDTYIQIIEGRSQLFIEGVLHILEAGHSIIIPANKARYFKANGEFKMIQTIIKSGYENVV